MSALCIALSLIFRTDHKESGFGRVGQDGARQQVIGLPACQCLERIRPGQPAASVGDANLENIVFLWVQHSQDRPRRIQRDFVLTGPSTKQDGDLQFAVYNGILIHHFYILCSLLSILYLLLPLADIFHFKFKLDPELIQDGLLRQVDQRTHIGRFRLAGIDEKVGMLAADGGIADTFSF